MNTYLIMKTLHIISSTILFGTGLGIAFFMYRSQYTSDIQEKYYAVRTTVLADFIFTLPAVLIQPLTGAWLVWRVGYGWDNNWLLLSYGLYLLAGACWLPVVWIQMTLSNMLKHCINENKDLPARYYRLFRLWFILGWPAFLGLILIFYLMTAKPTGLPW